MLNRTKHKIADKIKKITHTKELQQEIQKLSRKIDMTNMLLATLLPDHIEYDTATQDALKRFLKVNKLSAKTNTSIFKNDLMFMFLLYNRPSIESAVIQYMKTGLQAAKIIEEVRTTQFNDSQKLTMLDFASGYGRVTRFLPGLLKNTEVWVSEIKPQANKYLEKEYKVKSVQSEYNPKDLKFPKKFDIIFVGSLFTHLPQDDYQNWLETLYKALTKDGVLIISTHNPKLLNEEKEVDFYFTKVSEDQLFSFIGDSIKKEDKYGLTYIHTRVVDKLLKEIGTSNHQHYYKLLWGGQDIYTISRSKKKIKKLNFTELKDIPA